MTMALQRLDVLKVHAGVARTHGDVAAAEEPLEIRLNGTSFVHHADAGR